MRRMIFLALLLVFSTHAFATQTLPESLNVGSQRRISLDRDWRFLKGDAPGAEQPNVDDSEWRTVRLPHDWVIEGPFSKQENPHEGALPVSGTGWYRKHFVLPASAKGRYFTVEFDGAMSNAHVWLNGKELGERPYGYSSFAFDLTPYLNFDSENVLAVRLTPEKDASRWYPGAGIYRNVWLTITGPVRVAHWGTYVTTPEVSDVSAQVRVRTDVQNAGTSAAKAVLLSTVLDANGREVARASTPIEVPANRTQRADTTINVAHPQRWEIDQPYLYTLVSTVQEN